MKTVAASAPGKLVLAGEYAVLDGAPALALALDRRAKVGIAPAGGALNVVTAPGYCDLPGTFAIDAEGLSWRSGGTPYALFERLWREADVQPAAPLAVVLDTTEFHDPRSGRKIGIGSSAAVSAALATALAAFGGANAATVAQRAHHDFQGGAGSGVDVAASLAGGIIEFHADGHRASAVGWPRGLRFSVLWSGVAADTPARLRRFGAQPALPARRELCAAARHVAQVFRDGHTDQVLDELGRYVQALRRFDSACELGIFAAGHGTLMDRATAHGVVYKPCGAGGGDIGIALAATAESLASFEALAAQAGYTRLDVRLDPHGAMLIDDERQ